MTLSSSVAREPPWTEPSGLKRYSAAGMHIRAVPGSTDTSSMPSSWIAGGGGIFPAMSARRKSIPARACPAAAMARGSAHSTILRREGSGDLEAASPVIGEPSRRGGERRTRGLADDPVGRCRSGGLGVDVERNLYKCRSQSKNTERGPAGPDRMRSSPRGYRLRRRCGPIGHRRPDPVPGSVPAMTRPERGAASNRLSPGSWSAPPRAVRWPGPRRRHPVPAPPPPPWSTARSGRAACGAPWTLWAACPR